MTKEALLEKIESLPEEKLAEVEASVDFLRERHRPKPAPSAVGSSPDELRRRVEERAERLRRDCGLFDSVAVIRELRDNHV